MRKIDFTVTALAASFFVHLFAISGLLLYIKYENSPVFYSWIDIAARKDSAIKNKGIIFIPEVNFSAGRPNKNYFLSLMPTQKPVIIFSQPKHNVLAGVPKQAAPEESYAVNETACLYLWDRPQGMSYRQEESATYKVFVSPYGKVIFSFPEKLPFNSYGNVSLQEYIRESTVFFEDKFCWTKLDGIVK